MYNLSGTIHLKKGKQQHVVVQEMVVLVWMGKND